MIKLNFKVFLMLISLNVFSQQKNIKGSVYVEGQSEPLVGVSVKVIGTNKGTITDFDGNFEIKEVTAGQELEFSSLGFFTKKIKIQNQFILTVKLKEDVQRLDDVIVVGYGTQKKKEITGAVAVIESDVIEKLNPVRVEQAIQGQVAGVGITSSSGSPGSGLNIRIRGISTNGENKPLILVDGNPITDLSAINPNDIKSVNVLKDASAGIYGVRAANGVIIIETKSGKKSSPLKFSVDSYYAFQQTSKKIDLLSPSQFAEYYNDATGTNRFFVQQITGDILDTNFSVSDVLNTSDWQEEVFEVAPMYNVNLSASGGTEKLSYAIGGSYLSQDGIIGGANSNFSRYTGRAKFGYDISDRIKLTANIIYTNSEKQNLAEDGIGSVLYNAINADPLTGVLDSNALSNAGFEQYRGGFGVVTTSAIEVANPVAQIANTFDTTTRNRISPSLSLEFKLHDDLTLRTKYLYNYEAVNYDIFRPLAFYGSGKQLTRVTQNSRENNFDYYNDYTINNVLNYKKTFGKVHSLEVLLGTEIRELTGDYTGSTGLLLSDLSNSYADAKDLSNFTTINPRYTEGQLLVGENKLTERLSSLFTRVQYNYKEKYLFSGMLRRDTSAAFGPNNKVGVFPSASIGWVVSEEKFMEGLNFISSLKLRASSGQIGNDRIGDFRFVQRINGEAVISNNTEATLNDLVVGVAEGVLANPNVKWETTNTSNIGLDLYMLNNRINITADAYVKTTEDLLVDPDASAVLGIAGIGAGNPFINAGDVRNSGFEFLISYKDNFTKDFSFNASLNVATLKNEVLFVASDTGLIESGGFGVGTGITTSRMEAGNEIGYFYGYKTDGIYQNQAEIDALNANAPSGTYHEDAEVGDLVFVDVNGDGEINEDDKTDIGDPLPSLTGGFNIGIGYKGFDFSASAIGSYGNDMVRDYERVNVLANKSTRVLDAWTVNNPSTTTPRATSGKSINTDNFSDYYVEDASYLRIQNIQVGYSFSKKLMSKINIDKLRLYVSANNLHTFTNYSGFDPSASNGDPLESGLDRGFYPVAETYIFGMNLSF